MNKTIQLLITIEVEGDDSDLADVVGQIVLNKETIMEGVLDVTGTNNVVEMEAVVLLPHQVLAAHQLSRFCIPRPAKV